MLPFVRFDSVVSQASSGQIVVCVAQYSPDASIPARSVAVSIGCGALVMIAVVLLAAAVVGSSAAVFVDVVDVVLGVLEASAAESEACKAEFASRLAMAPARLFVVAVDEEVDVLVTSMLLPAVPTVPAVPVFRGSRPSFANSRISSEDIASSSCRGVSGGLESMNHV